MTTIIVMPALNEAATVGAVVQDATAWAPVLVIDDGSSDDTATTARRAGAEVIRHERRRGKGQAILTGIAAARERGARMVVTMDADGQHDPRDLGLLLAAAHEAPGTLVVGCRRDPETALPPARLNARTVASFFTSWVTGRSLRDTQSGYRVYPIELFDEIRPSHGGFVLETEVLVAAVRRGFDIVEIDVGTLPRGARRSRFRPVTDGIAIGSYLAGPVLQRWGVEILGGVAALGRPFRGERRRARHAALLGAGAPYAQGSGAWAAAIGAEALERGLDEVGGLWRSPHWRRAMTAARGTVATPLILPLLALQAVGPQAMPDVLTPLVERLYGSSPTSSVASR